MENNRKMHIGRVICSPELDKLFEGLAKAQAAMSFAEKDATNPHFKSSYATLGSTWEAIRPHLGPNGVCMVQVPYTEKVGTALWAGTQTIMGHKSGQFISSEMSLPVDKPTAQGCGSGFTYGRRYAAQGYSSISPDDDDGNEASRGGGPAPAVASYRGDPKQKAALYDIARGISKDVTPAQLKEISDLATGGPVSEVRTICNVYLREKESGK